jgi:hypothetical protein
LVVSASPAIVPAMWLAPVAACVTLRLICVVVAVCSSTAEAMAVT